MADEHDADALLRDLASLAREEEAREAALLDERWDRLARGELGPEEEATLRAGAAEGDGAEEAERRFEAFRPLSEDFRARVAAKLLAEVGKGAAPSTPPGPRALRTGPAPLRTGARSLRWRLLAAAVALVGAVLLLPRLLVPPFPGYEVALVPTGEATERSLAEAPLGGTSEAPSGTATERPALFHPGTAFEVAVRPLAEIADLHGALQVRCFLQDGARLRPWPSCAERAEIAPTRAVRIAGTLGEDLTLEPGTWTLWIVLGRKGRIADLERHPALLAGPEVAKRNWIALQVPRPLRMEPLP